MLSIDPIHNWHALGGAEVNFKPCRYEDMKFEQSYELRHVLYGMRIMET